MPLVSAVSPSAATEGIAQNATPIDEDRLDLWLDKARRAADYHAAHNQTQKRREKGGTGIAGLHTYIGRGKSEERDTMQRTENDNQHCLTNTINFIQYRIIFALKSCATGNRLSPVERGV